MIFACFNVFVCLQQRVKLSGGDDCVSQRVGTSAAARDFNCTKRRITTGYQPQIYLPSRPKIHWHSTAQPSYRVRSVKHVRAVRAVKIAYWQRILINLVSI